MKLKRMTASFGKLEGQHLELGPGLNIIHAPNEGGKSTWAGFLKAMLYGIDTRDRDKKGYLADKNRYQPWSGAPMEGELVLEWQGREVAIRRGPKGNVPFGSFSAVYTDTGDAVPGLTGDSCGPLLLGVEREVYERSAFIGQSGTLAVTSAPELEKRIAALVSSGEEDVSYSQTEGRLREWLRRRRVNKSVGLIPKLEGELAQTENTLGELEQVTLEIARLSGQRAQLAALRRELEEEQLAHRRLAQRELNRRFAQAKEELEGAKSALAALEKNRDRFGALPDKERLKRAQGELQYLKVLDEEIKQGETALKEAEEAYVQAQIAIQDPNFQGLSGEEALRLAGDDRAVCQQAAARAGTERRRFPLLQLIGLALFGGLTALDFTLNGGLTLYFWLGLGCYGAAAALSGLALYRAGKAREQGERVLARYGLQSPEQLDALALDYARRWQRAEDEAAHSRQVRGTLNDRKARRDNSRSDLFSFVHGFAPEVSDLFGCSAALSRALGLEDRLREANERLELTRRRCDDLAAQGGREADTLELIAPPRRSPQETAGQLGAVQGELERVDRELNIALGRQKAVGDPAALAAQREALERELARRRGEYAAITTALEALERANSRLQERFSPQLNRQAGQLLSRLTGGKYASLTLTRELEGAVTEAGAILPRKALALSRGTVDQLYLAVRLAVCRLCLGAGQAPLVLDDALAAFDDGRMALALDLLAELGEKEQILLFTCQRREGAYLAGRSGVTGLSLL